MKLRLSRNNILLRLVYTYECYIFWKDICHGGGFLGDAFFVLLSWGCVAIDLRDPPLWKPRSWRAAGPISQCRVSPEF